MLWDIFGKNYGIYSAKIMGCIGQTLWDILWDILVKNCWIYLAKTMGYIGPLYILRKN